jgi:2-succinyl-5-enolpyruvyl-6-hydroxy-3-cyclohexene-1-carboxylate synthase
MNSFDLSSNLIKSCLRRGIYEFVICAGARNAVLLEVLAQAESRELVKIWHHFDERSAGFFALGRTMNGMPCAVITTSGTAVAELLPSVIEAYYQQRPLIVISADRPARFRGTGSPQAIEQLGIFGNYAPCGEISEWSGKSPWHVNIELEEEFSVESFSMNEDEIGEWEATRSPMDVAELARWLRSDNYRGLVVILSGLEPDEREDVWHFVKDLGAPVLIEATSGLREALGDIALPDGDRLLKETLPGKVLRIGNIPSGRFWRDLEDCHTVDVWSISSISFAGLARKNQMTIGHLSDIIAALGIIEKIGDPLGYFDKISRRGDLVEDLIESLPESEPAWMRIISVYASVGESIYLGNSMPIREWNLFSQWEKPMLEVRANRGANGIDGQISTWLGATADRENAWAIVGDLTALYDLSGGFLLDQCECKGRIIIVINNGGGKIFERLPRLRSMSPEAQEWMLNSHEIHLAGWADMLKIKYKLIKHVDDLDDFEVNDDVILLEIIPSLSQTAEFWQRWESLA